MSVTHPSSVDGHSFGLGQGQSSLSGFLDIRVHCADLVANDTDEEQQIGRSVSPVRDLIL